MSREQSFQLNPSNYPERWKFLFEIYQSDGLFMLVYLIRVAFLSLIVGCLSEYPHIQAILIVLINFGMLFYLILGSPIAKKISYIQHMVIETALLVYNGVFAILAVFDLKSDRLRDTSGQLLMILYLITSLITAMLILMKLLHQVYRLLFKANGGLQTGHIQLREFSQNSEYEEEINENSQQQRNVADEIVVGFREINQEGKCTFLLKIKTLDTDPGSEENSIEADVLVE